MPELPEVETIKNQLSDYLPMTVEKVDFSDVAKGVIKDEEFSLKKSDRILSVERYGKVLIFNLSKNRFIISGLGMSGSWRISNEKITAKHTHVHIEGTSSRKKVFLGYVDPRRFGNIHFLTKKNKDQWLTRLGPDASTENFNEEFLIDLCLKKPKKVLKPLLLDQSIISGIGNYMASEICARAKVMPDRKLSSLSKKDCKNIILATHSVLNDTIKNNGTTFSGGYADAYGEKGRGVENLVVFYQKICGMCKEESVTKITLAGRGTYFCSKCQK